MQQIAQNTCIYKIENRVPTASRHCSLDEVIQSYLPDRSLAQCVWGDIINIVDKLMADGHATVHDHVTLVFAVNGH